MSRLSQFSDNNTNAYFKVSTGGVERIRVLENGALSVGPDGTSVGMAGNVLVSQGPSSPPVWASSSSSTGVEAYSAY